MRRIIAILTIALAMISISQTCRPEEMSKSDRRQLFREGAKLWPVYCAQCHNARPGSEFAPYQWDIILMHMRTQANLPPKNARAVLEYLKSSR